MSQPPDPTKATPQEASWLPQLASYGVVGGVQLLVEWAGFVVGTLLGVPLVLANLVARAGAAALGFWLNGSVTFRGVEGARLGWQRGLRFGVTWAALAALSTAAVWGFNAWGSMQAAWMLKPAVDALLAVAAFLLSRMWVYR